MLTAIISEQRLQIVISDMCGLHTVVKRFLRPGDTALLDTSRVDGGIIGVGKGRSLGKESKNCNDNGSSELHVE